MIFEERRDPKIKFCTYFNITEVGLTNRHDRHQIIKIKQILSDITK